MTFGDSSNYSDELANKTMDEETQKDLEIWNDNWKKLNELSSEMIEIENALLNIKAKDLNRRNIKDFTLHKTYSNLRLVEQINRMFEVRIHWWHEFKTTGPLGIFYILVSFIVVKFSNLRK